MGAGEKLWISHKPLEDHATLAWIVDLFVWLGRWLSYLGTTRQQDSMLCARAGP